MIVERRTRSFSALGRVNVFPNPTNATPSRTVKTKPTSQTVELAILVRHKTLQFLRLQPSIKVLKIRACSKQCLIKHQYQGIYCVLLPQNKNFQRRGLPRPRAQKRIGQRTNTISVQLYLLSDIITTTKNINRIGMLWFLQIIVAGWNLKLMKTSLELRVTDFIS